MNRVMTAKTLIALGLVASALALSGCGRRGALEAPGATAQAAATPANPADVSTSVSTTADGAPVDNSVPVRRGAIVAPDRPFILDKIL